LGKTSIKEVLPVVAVAAVAGKGDMEDDMVLAPAAVVAGVAAVDVGVRRSGTRSCVCVCVTTLHYLLLYIFILRIDHV
jgi:hypothetical protein